MDDTSVSPININDATVDELLQAVSGLDVELAERIVAYRDQHGPFDALDDLAAVPGIEAEWLERFGPHLKLGVPPSDPEIRIIPTIETPLEPAAEAATAASKTHPLSATAENDGQDAGITSVGADFPPEAEASAVSPTAVPGVEPVGTLEEELPELARFIEESEQQEGALLQAASEPPVEESNVTVEQRQVAQPAPVVESRLESNTQQQTAAQRMRLGFWRSAVLVALGGLAGALLSLGILALLSGTLNFAPRREYNALSRNVDTMQRNQEVTWERVDSADAQVAELEREVARLSALESRLGTVESSLEAAEATLQGITSDLSALSQSMAEVGRSVQTLDQRVGVAEGTLSTLTLSMDELERGVAALQERVARYDAFIAALRGLLDELEMPSGAPLTTG